jgi:hypothetical protein
MAERKKWKGIDEDYFGMKELIKNNGGLPRMADWSILAEQIAAVITRKEGKSYELGTFLKEFETNLQVLNTEALKSSLVAEALISFMTNREVMLNVTEWEGSATMLLSALNDFIAVNSESIKINTRTRAWPQNPSTLGGELAKIKPNLSPLGIIVDSFRTNKNVLYKITKAPLHSPDSLHALHTLHENEENIQDSVGSVGSVGQTPNEGGTVTISDATIQELLNKGLSNKDYFTEDDWVFTCLLWPNLQMTVNEAEQTFYQLLKEGKVRELESGKYQPKEELSIGSSD